MAKEKRRVKDGKPGCGKKWPREASKDGKREGQKKENAKVKCKRWEGQRGKRNTQERSVKVGGGKEILPEKHKRWKN